MKGTAPWILPLLLASLSGCLSPRSILPPVSAGALEAERAQQRERFLLADEARRARLHAVAFPLLEESAAFFPTATRPALGVLVVTGDAFATPYRALAEQHWGLAEGPVVSFVAPGSPAAAAGLQSGDRLVAIDGAALPASPPEAYLRALRDGLAAGEASELTVQRDDQVLHLAATPVRLADYRVLLKYDGRINAAATGRAITVNRGMIDFCAHDTELAFVVAHEFAHNALRHQRDQILNYLMGSVADLGLLLLQLPSPNLLGLIGAHHPSPDYEAEADYIALYLLVRTGHELDALLDFWPRLAQLAPEQRRRRFAFETHPDPASRQVRLRAAIAEIRRLQAEGRLLSPRRR